MFGAPDCSRLEKTVGRTPRVTAVHIPTTVHGRLGRRGERKGAKILSTKKVSDKSITVSQWGFASSGGEIDTCTLLHLVQRLLNR